jgi:hypothetical protein
MLPQPSHDRTAPAPNAVEPGTAPRRRSGHQTMWCYASNFEEWREHAGAAIAAYNKTMAVGGLQSTAERAAAAVAYKIDAGYRAFQRPKVHDDDAHPSLGHEHRVHVAAHRRLSVRLRHSRSNTSTEYSLPPGCSTRTPALSPDPQARGPQSP